VTHELRTPLASIQAAASSLTDPDVEFTQAEREEFAEAIAYSADRLDRQVRNLLTLSRLDAGIGTPEKQIAEIAPLIDRVVMRLELARQTREHRITVAVEPDLPQTSLDIAQIEQVLTNLIENAIKYSSAHSEIRVSATLDRSTDPPQICLAVRDQGIGIPATEIDLIFDRFYRVKQVQIPGRRQSPPGSGLGLAICDAIVRHHGGRIAVESIPGEGSTFFVYLPVSTNVVVQSV
jgi:two-component system sensor histidine kinase KdpD